MSDPTATPAADDATVRAFLAVDLDDRARAAARARVSALREGPGGPFVRWVRPENLHVTLRFLGDVPARLVRGGRRLPGVREIGRRVAIELAAHAPFSLRLGGLLAFPSERRPRVVALELSPRAPLEALARAVERAVVALGFAPEARPFHPHVTLGRVRRDARPAQVRALFTALGAAARSATEQGGSASGAAAPGHEGSFRVHEVVLFRSDLQPSGAVYTALERIPLPRPDSVEPTNHPS